MATSDGSDCTVSDGPHEGVFWHPDTPQRRRNGRLSYVRGEDAVLTLAGPVVDEAGITYEFKPNEISIRIGGSAEERVSAWEPITLHGVLGDGTLATVLYAQGGYDQSAGTLGQRYQSRFVVHGDHVPGPDQLYDSVRYQIGGWRWWDGIDVGDTVPAGEGSTLTVEESAGAVWLRYIPSGPRTLRGLLNTAVTGCQALAALVVDETPSVVRVQIRLDATSPWLEIVGSRTRDNLETTNASKLMPWAVLTADRLGRWIQLNAHLDGLAWGVIEPPEGPIQVELLTVASVAEGLHRRLRPTQRKRFELSNGAIDRIRRAARDAGVERFALEGFADRVRAAEVLNEELAHINEISFRQRISELVEIAIGVVPETIESFPDYTSQLVQARNELAHHLLPKGDETLDVRVLRWATLSRAVPWVLRIVLLTEAGIPAAEIRESVLMSSRFKFHRANSRQMARELGWDFTDPATAAVCG
ncbi:HEPN domain-containing protein [Nocardia sp. NPDC049707]|uniref:HEPN domain-containing protein n=1 Tax=Nocardia sp. NPDC049707 TaxID=3154735 RepID=UPI003429B615